MRPFVADKLPRPNLGEEILTRLHARPLDVEIGAGQGLHAIRYCQANPGRTLLAIERTHTKFGALLSRVEHHPGIQNLLAVNADARSVLAHYIADASLARVFLLYPNPHPKPKHANLRWHNSPFMHCLIAKMQPGSVLTIATNLRWYRDEAVHALTSQWKLALTSERELEDENAARTHFEAKYLKRGETCYGLEFTKGSGI